MGGYAVTTSAMGMGCAAAVKLRAAGQTVIGVDLRGAEVIADLSTPAGRRLVDRGAGVRDPALAAAGAGVRQDLETPTYSGPEPLIRPDRR